MKNIQVPISLIADMLELISCLDEYNLKPEHAILVDEIHKEISDKVERMKRHELYTQSKVAKTPEEREQARQGYLNKVGMRDSFRY